MKILIASGLRAKDIGGPAQYGLNLQKEFNNFGHKARLISYGRIERVLPVGVRHLYFLFRILPSCVWADRVIALDTFSVGVPTIMASKLCGKKSVVRVGGDFLWESFVNRTGEKIILPDFYKTKRNFNLKEKTIFFLTNFLVKNASTLAFNTEWQKKIWTEAYKISSDKTVVIQNFIPKSESEFDYKVKNLLWAGRESKVKNLDTLIKVNNELKLENKEFVLDLVSNLSHEELIKKIKNCYAVILPSLSDVSPNFVLEAISFGKPFIVTKYTGINEICSKGGIFIDPMNEFDLQKAVETMLDTTEYNKFVSELSQQDLKPRSWSEVANDFLNI